MIKVIYAGTFDPITRGHEDIARRAANLFDNVIVGVAGSSHKRTFFGFNDRVEMAREVLKPYKNVSVLGFKGLLMDFLQEQKARAILRGLRAVSDFEFEFQMAGMNRNLYPNVETMFLTPSEQYMFVSATMVREIASLGGDVTKFVQPIVADYLSKKVKVMKEK